MNGYESNRECRCSRCRTRSFFWPVMMITVGVLATLDEFTGLRWHQTWPILLIVVGLVKILSSNADPAGHVPPQMAMPVPVVPPVEPPQAPPQEVNHV